jgi:hypothetical protein
MVNSIGSTTTTPSTACGGSPQGKPSAIDTLAKELGISPDQLKELLKAELAQRDKSHSQKSSNPSGQAGDKTPNPSGEAGDVNGDGKVDEKDLEVLAQQRLDALKANGQNNLNGRGDIDGAPSGVSASPSGLVSGAIG